MSSTSDTFHETQDRKVNGPRGFKTTVRLDRNNERVAMRSYWRRETPLAPRFLIVAQWWQGFRKVA